MGASFWKLEAVYKNEERMKRFLVSEPLEKGKAIRLSPQESKHALRVLRLKLGDKVLLVNGRGVEAVGVIQTEDKEGALIEVAECKQSEQIRETRIELFQSCLKGPRMDWLVEKLVELGVDALYPVNSKYTVAQGEKEERWQRIAQSAAKQSGNPIMPEIHPVTPFDSRLKELPRTDSLCILLSPQANMGLGKVIEEQQKRKKAKRLILAIGPEGGFSEEEEEELLLKGFIPAALSKQILRGETAAITALAIAVHAIDF